MIINAEGWLDGVRRAVSPNADARPPGMSISLLVLHGISLPPGCFGGEDIEALFCNRLDPARHAFYETLRGLRVSAHLLIRRDGAMVQFVPFERRAWHAGASCWKGRERCNDFSIGVELEGADDLPYADPQYEALARLVPSLRQRYPLPDIAGHCDVAPGRKTDPGPAFDWGRLHRLLG
jgi:N-acetyl-anhydromuramoyl-L-alanine amidase